MNDIDIDIAKCFVAFHDFFYSFRYQVLRAACIDTSARVPRHDPVSQLNAFIAGNDFVVTSNEINQSVRADSAAKIVRSLETANIPRQDIVQAIVVELDTGRGA